VENYVLTSGLLVRIVDQKDFHRRFSPGAGEDTRSKLNFGDAEIAHILAQGQFWRRWGISRKKFTNHSLLSM